MAFTPSENPITNPTRESYTQLRPFRFWCQKVLPLVYDDSLSYYELLCKVVDYLNKTMEDVDHMNTDMDTLYSNFHQFQEGTFRIYNELVDYVNTYFDELDVQEEINNKLDAMASSGELTTILSPTIANEVSTWLNEHLTPTSPSVDDTLTISGAAADSKTVGDKLSDLKSAFKPITRKHNLIDPSILLYTNNSGIVNNNNGTYTLNSGDYGDAFFGAKLTLEPGYYYLYGVPQGIAFLSTTTESAGTFESNAQSSDKVIYISQTKECYLGFRVGSSPSESFVIAPYIEKDVPEDNKVNISQISGEIKPITRKHNLIDPSILLTSNNSAIVNNNNGTYTLKTNDYGDSIFGAQITLEPGSYYLYGVPSGKAYISITTGSAGAFEINDQPTEKIINITERTLCYLGFRIETYPSASFVIAPYIEEAIPKDFKEIINSLHLSYLPNLETDTSFYTSTTGNELYISDRIISAKSYIKSITAYINDTGTGYVVFFDKDDKVTFVKEFSYSGTKWITVDIDYANDVDVRYGIYCRVKYKNGSTTPMDCAFSIGGLYQATSATKPDVGDTITYSNVSSDRFVLAFQIKYYADKKESAIIQHGWLPKGLQTSGKIPRYLETEGSYALIGRWYKQTVNGIECDVTNNCGSEIHFKTVGASSITITFQAMTATNAYYSVSIDGGQLTRKSISSGSIALPNTNVHYVRIVMDGIAENIGKWEYGKGFAISSITCDKGEIRAAYPQNPLIMFFGDSITEGIRALGMEQSDMGDVNSATGAFPWYCCAVLKAIPFRIGYGASGIEALGSFSKAINAVDYLYNGVPVPQYFPDAIVLNYGTNDTSVSSANFKSGYNALLNDLRAKYPGVKIFAMVPFNQNHASDIITVGEQNEDISVIQTASWTGITYTDSIHPTAAGAKVAGEYLADDMIEIIYRN